MKNKTVWMVSLLMLLTGCKLIADASRSGGGGHSDNEDDLVASRHHHPADADRGPAADASPVRSVHENGAIPEVKGPHPRLFFADAEIPMIMDAVHRDPTLSAKFELLQHEGEKMLAEPQAEYIHDTEKALIASRLVLSRVGTLAGLYRLTGDTKFAARAREEMLAAATFADWHPADFLPTAELLNAEGIGYDWLYKYLSAEERHTILEAIMSKGLVPAKTAYDRREDWTYSTSNHNPVGNGGVAVAAVAIADDDPKLAKELINDTRHSLPPAMKEYGPDGAWPEGPIYWDYATRYATFYLAALDTGIGTDFGASTYPGLSDTGMFRIYSTGPTKKTFNFGDAEEQVHPAPFMFYLAKRFDKPVYASHEELVSLPEANIFEVIWRARFGPIEPFDQLAEGHLPTDAIFRGVDVAFLRGDWNDADATWVGFKGGTNKGSHRHLDLGSFVMDALGQRWGLDLGPDDYGLPGYNGSEKRWTYYRCSTEGHNTLTIDNKNQDPDGDSTMRAFHSAPDRSYAVVEMTNAYAHARRIVRGIALINQHQVATIDEVEMEEPSRITWNFHTRAKVTTRGANAILTLGGKTLQAQIISPPGATFETVSANPPRPQKQQPDVTNLIVHLPELVTKTRIIVLLTPDARGNEEVRADSVEHDRAIRTPKFEPLDAWMEASPVKEVR